MSTPGQLLRKWRTDEGKAFATAAKDCEVERQTWWRWENDLSKVSPDKLDAVAGMTGIDKMKLRPDLVALLGAA